MTVKKMIADRLRAHRNKAWVEMMEASVKRYNNQKRVPREKRREVNREKGNTESI